MNKQTNTSELEGKFLHHEETIRALKSDRTTDLLGAMKIEDPKKIQALAVSLIEGSLNEEWRTVLRTTMKQIKSMKNWEVFRKWSWKIDWSGSQKDHDPYGQWVVEGRIAEYEELWLLNAKGEVMIWAFFDALEKMLWSEWASEEAIVHMDARYDAMNSSNRPSEQDMLALKKLPLRVRKEGGVNIVKLEEFWEFASTTSMGAQYRDMDKNGERNPAHLSESPKLKGLAEKVWWLSIMSEERTYELMNEIGQALGIKQTISKEYINTVFEEHSNEDLPKDHPLGRIGRAMSVILWDWFVIPISVNGRFVRSFDCNVNGCWVCDNVNDSDYVAPFAEVGGSPTA